MSGTERDWLRSANTPRLWTTHPGKVTREDLFNAIDLLGRQLNQKDALLDPGIRARLTEIRSLAATLCPKPRRHVCDHILVLNGRKIRCGIACKSADALAEHRSYHTAENLPRRGI